jgi:hypothetical protein
MNKKTDFIGLDTDLSVSLEKYGIICRNERSDEYMCFYKKNDLYYDYAFIYESELHDLLDLKSWIDKKTKNEFLEFCGQKVEDVKKLPFVHKLFSMIQFFGVKDIMGESFECLTLKDALSMMYES